MTSICVAPQCMHVLHPRSPVCGAVLMHSEKSNAPIIAPHTHHWVAAQFEVTVSERKTCVCGASIVFAQRRERDTMFSFYNNYFSVASYRLSLLFAQFGWDSLNQPKVTTFDEAHGAAGRQETPILIGLTSHLTLELTARPLPRNRVIARQGRALT